MGKNGKILAKTRLNGRVMAREIFFHQCLWVTKFCAKFGRSRIPRRASIPNSFIVLRCMWKEPAPLKLTVGMSRRDISIASSTTANETQDWRSQGERKAENECIEADLFRLKLLKLRLASQDDCLQRANKGSEGFCHYLANTYKGLIFDICFIASCFRLP